jgi:hypothetical protein
MKEKVYQKRYYLVYLSPFLPLRRRGRDWVFRFLIALLELTKGGWSNFSGGRRNEIKVFLLRRGRIIWSSRQIFVSAATPTYS